MRIGRSLSLTLAGWVGLLAAPANATTIFSDLFEWYDDGTVLMTTFVADGVALPVPVTVQLRAPGRRPRPRGSSGRPGVAAEDRRGRLGAR